MGTRIRAVPMPNGRRLVLVLALALAPPVFAADLVSASFRSRAGHVGSGAAVAQTAASFSAGGSTGQSEAVGPGGSTTSLVSSSGGFWPIVAGGFPSLDVDADGRQAFLDDDDDGDGLADAVETGTGVYVSASDTGTNPNAIDSDGDGYGDGAEVALGTDPNDPAFPVPAAVPAVSPTGVILLLSALAAGALRSFRGGRR